VGAGGAAVLSTGGPAVMTDDGPSAKRRRLPGLEDALAKRALREGAGPLPWLVRDMFSGEVLEFDGRSGYHLAQARQVAGLYFDPGRPLAVVAADGDSFVGQNMGLAKLVKPSRGRPEPGLSEESFRCVCACVCVRAIGPMLMLLTGFRPSSESAASVESAGRSPSTSARARRRGGIQVTCWRHGRGK
jgi:hypothetical protein